MRGNRMKKEKIVNGTDAAEINNKKAITLNSNSRSKCVGCKFCGTYSLSEDDAVDFSTEDKIQQYFETLLKVNNIQDMSGIENITVCTGCFKNEDALVDHLLTLREGTGNLGFNGSINYIGSQLRDYDKVKLLKDTIGDFGIYLTIEKFLERERFMKKEKASLTLEKARDLLQYSSSIGVTSTFLYILGLEDLETVEKYMNYFKGSINKFPIVQVFQDYTPEQENYRCEDAKKLDYYLKDDIKEILFVIGPEGGFTNNEEDFLIQNGFSSTTLGKRILRVETAAIYVASIINYIYEG